MLLVLHLNILWPSRNSFNLYYRGIKQNKHFQKKNRVELWIEGWKTQCSVSNKHPLCTQWKSGLLQSLRRFRWVKLQVWDIYLAGIYLFKINNRNTRKRFEICSKVTMKTPEQRHWRCSFLFIVNFEHISTLNFFLSFCYWLWTSKC